MEDWKKLPYLFTKTWKKLRCNTLFEDLAGLFHSKSIICGKKPFTDRRNRLIKMSGILFCKKIMNIFIKLCTQRDRQKSLVHFGKWKLHCQNMFFTCIKKVWASDLYWLFWAEKAFVQIMIVLDKRASLSIGFYVFKFLENVETFSLVKLMNFYFIGQRQLFRDLKFKLMKIKSLFMIRSLWMTSHNLDFL